MPVEKLDEVLSNGRDYPTGTLLCEAILCEQPAILHDLIQLGCDLEQECALDIFFPVPFVDTGKNKEQPLGYGISMDQVEQCKTDT